MLIFFNYFSKGNTLLLPEPAPCLPPLRLLPLFRRPGCGRGQVQRPAAPQVRHSPLAAAEGTRAALTPSSAVGKGARSAPLAGCAAPGRPSLRKAPEVSAASRRDPDQHPLFLPALPLSAAMTALSPRSAAGRGAVRLRGRGAGGAGPPPLREGGAGAPPARARPGAPRCAQVSGACA